MRRQICGYHWSRDGTVHVCIIVESIYTLFTFIFNILKVLSTRILMYWLHGFEMYNIQFYIHSHIRAFWHLEQTQGLSTAWPHLNAITSVLFLLSSSTFSGRPRFPFPAGVQISAVLERKYCHLIRNVVMIICLIL